MEYWTPRYSDPSTPTQCPSEEGSGTPRAMDFGSLIAISDFMPEQRNHHSDPPPASSMIGGASSPARSWEAGAGTPQNAGYSLSSVHVTSPISAQRIPDSIASRSPVIGNVTLAGGSFRYSSNFPPHHDDRYIGSRTYSNVLTDTSSHPLFINPNAGFSGQLNSLPTGEDLNPVLGFLECVFRPNRTLPTGRSWLIALEL